MSQYWKRIIFEPKEGNLNLNAYLKGVVHGERRSDRICFYESLESVGRRSGVVDHDRRGLALVQRQLRVQASNLQNVKSFCSKLSF